MPPRLRLLNSYYYSITTCAKPFGAVKPAIAGTSASWQRQSLRYISAHEKPLPTADEEGKGPNTDQLPHVSEEAAQIGEITGEGGPELEQGTPVQEILKRDNVPKEKLPKVMQDEMKKSSNQKPNNGTRSFSTLARRFQQMDITPPSGGGEGEPPLPPSIAPNNSLSTPAASSVETPGHKFPLPDAASMPRFMHLRHRYSPIIDQMTKLIMRDGKLSVAQRNMTEILNHLRIASPPTPDPRRPLVANAPPPHTLPYDPIAFLTTSIDSVAPLINIKSLKGAAGGGFALQLPIPLRARQRRRTAINWILQAVDSKGKSTGGARPFAQRVADEIVGVIEGRSSVWEKRQAVHRLGVSARANVGTAKKARKKKLGK
ncbi:MAG: hypothetical protein M1834_003194 [Cirrosporium novae-zelandiae]|nr:MAG: hypothetical protein M1834_003194 [Cirrosporium novae-zelandiae]